MRPDTAAARYRVTRVSGLLVPGFTKRIRFSPEGAPFDGVTFFWGIRIGSFDVRPADEFGQGDASLRCLRYRTWPVVDLLGSAPTPTHGSPECEGCFRLPGLRRVRFCRFRLDPVR
jgi:hypothetical protein